MSSLLSTLALSSALLTSPVLGSSTPVTPDTLPTPDATSRSWVLDAPGLPAYLTLSDNGHAGGHDGCNNFGYIPWEGYEGPFWTQEDNHIAFHGMALATEMACRPHDNVLGKADAFILDGDNLLLFKDGELLGTMIPA